MVLGLPGSSHQLSKVKFNAAWSESSAPPPVVLAAAYTGSGGTAVLDAS